jgi:hypothetical protein
MDYNNSMPKLYEYFGLIVLFYSKEVSPETINKKLN